jgi:hypothetical protein
MFGGPVMGMDDAIPRHQPTAAFGNPTELPEALCDDLYWARIQFLHGMPVRSAMLHYRRSSDYPRLTDVAPVQCCIGVALERTRSERRANNTFSTNRGAYRPRWTAETRDH